MITRQLHARVLGAQAASGGASRLICPASSGRRPRCWRRRSGTSSAARLPGAHCAAGWPARLKVGRKLSPGLPLGDPGGAGLGGFGVLEPQVLGFGLRHRDERLSHSSSMGCQRCGANSAWMPCWPSTSRATRLASRAAISLPVYEDLRVTRADGDAAAELKLKCDQTYATPTAASAAESYPTGAAWTDGSAAACGRSDRKGWNTTAAKRRNLRIRGMSEHTARKWAGSSKAYWQVAGPAVQVTVS